MGHGIRFIIVDELATTPCAFVSFWSALYEDPREGLYDEGIERPLTAKRIESLFKWKNGGVLSQGKQASVKANFIDRLSELDDLPADITASDFLARFSNGGAIWRIFWMHCYQPHRFPIYDMHVHRAMTYLTDGQRKELGKHSDGEKIVLYLNDYLAFHDLFAGLDPRQVDRASGRLASSSRPGICLTYECKTGGAPAQFRQFLKNLGRAASSVGPAAAGPQPRPEVCDVMQPQRLLAR